MDIEFDLTVFTDPCLKAHRHRPVAIAEGAAEPLKAAWIVPVRLVGPSGTAWHPQTLQAFRTLAKRCPCTAGGITESTIAATVSALCFLFGVTPARPDVSRKFILSPRLRKLLAKIAPDRRLAAAADLGG